MTPGTDREEIVRRFEAVLDAALASENPPAGIDADILESVLNDSSDQAAKDQDNARACDSYALWAAMTALTQEIKLQGRAFQELNRTLATQTEKIADELRAVYAERERTLRRETERRSRKDVLGALIDLRDRLARGRGSAGFPEEESAAADGAGWLPRMLRKTFSRRPAGAAAAAVGALIRGYELGIERLDQTLDEFNAREIPCQGQSFDPRRMNAIDRQESGAVPEGTVIEEIGRA